MDELTIKLLLIDLAIDEFLSVVATHATTDIWNWANVLAMAKCINLSSVDVLTADFDIDLEFKNKPESIVGSNFDRTRC